VGQLQRTPQARHRCQRAKARNESSVVKERVVGIFRSRTTIDVLLLGFLAVGRFGGVCRCYCGSFSSVHD
jgi:hypothetical protein